MLRFILAVPRAAVCENRLCVTYALTVLLPIQYVAMILIGGLGTVTEAILGASFVTLVPEALRLVADAVRGPAPVFAERLT
jgi:ABC-type branched-subunit amino acid transport system permease subunit